MQPAIKDSTLFLGRSAEVEAKIQKHLDASKNFPTPQNKIFNIVTKVNDFNSLKSELAEAIIQVQDLAKKLHYKKKSKEQLKNLSPVSEKDLVKTVQVLGYDIIKEESENFLVSEFLNLANKTKDRNLKKIIKNAAWMGAIARGVADIIEYPENDHAFFAGLNYYLGTVIVGISDPRAFQEIEEMKSKGMDEHSSSEAILGLPLSEISKRFLLNNKIPEPVIDTVCNGKEHKNKDENNTLVAIVKYSEKIVKSINDDKKSIADIWAESKPYLDDLGIKLSFSDWSREIKLIFFKLIKLENEV
ncbi:MAG: HDOD domain-containing protein [Candidatus Caenarcaniphilales bacterium]|nr:HDOD domain-containing protein [Candidatus Caenarcaniphilales bacterium]